jgi:hydrogenase maturation protease
VLLILCIGNSLRRDDGAARVLAGRLEARPPGGVKVVAAHQLLPEHAEDIALSSAVLLADASTGDEEAVSLLPFSGDPATRPDLHGFSLPVLLELARSISGAHPPAYILRIPAFDFGHGEGLSPRTEAFVDDAERVLRAFAVAQSSL